MINSFWVRPVCMDDLEDIKALSFSATHGLTSLPKDETLLRQNIEKSIRSFDTPLLKPIDELYMFVLEDITTQKIIGTAGIISNVAAKDPFYTYHITPLSSHVGPDQSSPQILELSTNPFPSSELCMLFLHADYRNTHLGRFLSLVRFSFIKSHLYRFRSTLIAELRGLSYPNGECPFWDHIMRPFFKCSFFEADLASQQDPDLIHKHIPKHPFYIDVLPQDIQDCLSQLHPNTKGAAKILLAEDFHQTSYIDVFDAGPKYKAEIQNIKAIQRINPCEDLSLSADIDRKQMYILSSGEGPSFRACCVQGKDQKSQNTICVHDSPCMKRLLDMGPVTSYMRLISKVRRADSQSSTVIRKDVLSRPHSFMESFSKWHDTVEHRNQYGFYR